MTTKRQTSWESSSLDSIFTVEPSGDIPAMLKPNVQSEMTNLVVDEVTIKDKLERLNVCKSVGPDGIHPRILKEQCKHLCKPLHKLSILL